MIYTLTTNPAIDMNLTGKNILPNTVNRTHNTVYSPNGKGINVTLVLNHFNVKSKVLGFFGGFTGKYIIEELSKREILSEPIWVNGITRINVFINDGNKEYKFVNSGAFVSKENQKQLISLVENINDCESFIISGSLPQGIDGDFYEEILSVLNRKNIPFVLDISSPKLKDLLKYEPLLIKPNDEEIQKIFGIDVKNENDVINVMDFLKNNGVKNVLLTMGDKGSYFSNGEKVYFATTQKVKLVSSACAGDAALGAFLSVWLIEGDIEKAMKLSAATGANVAESDALGDLAKVEQYYRNIKVKEICTLI